MDLLIALIIITVLPYAVLRSAALTIKFLFR